MAPDVRGLSQTEGFYREMPGARYAEREPNMACRSAYFAPEASARADAARHRSFHTFWSVILPSRTTKRSM